MIYKKFVIFLCLFLFFLNPVKAEELKNILFTSELCSDCKEIDSNFYDFCKENNIEIISIDEKENLVYFKEFVKEYNLKSEIPLLCYENKFYLNQVEINSLLKNQNPFLFSILGFIDGFNPCAISILLIFVSLLNSLNKTKKNLIIGLFFILGTFISNFLLGIFINNITDLLSSFGMVINFIYIISLLICIYLMIINSIDIYNGFNKKDRIINQLNNETKYKISSIINKNIGSKYLIFISFFMGIGISLLEFGCTGQIYLPSIVAMENNLFYLFIYNLSFLIPLVIFFVLGYILNNPEILKKEVMKYSYILKIIFNIVLILLSINIIQKII